MAGVTPSAAEAATIHEHTHATPTTADVPAVRLPSDPAANGDPRDTLFTSVRVVCREHPLIEALKHVVAVIDAFFYAPQLSWMALEDAVTDDGLNLHLLRWLLSMATNQASNLYQHPFYLGLQITKAARLAVKNQRASPYFVQFMECLHAVDPAAVGENEVFEEAAGAGDLELLKWLHANCPADPEFVDSTFAALGAGGNDNMHVLQWLFENQWSSKSLFVPNDAIMNCQHEVLAWLDGPESNVLSQSPVVLDIEYDGFEDAAGRRNLDTLEWLFSHFPNEPMVYPSNATAANDHVHVLEWLYEFHPEYALSGRDGYVQTARDNHLDGLQ